MINLVSNSIKFTKTQKNRRIDVGVGASLGMGEKNLPWPMNYLPRTLTKSEGSLQSSWTAADSVNLHFAVQDTGGGMSNEERKLFFARFSQASPRTYIQHGGSGRINTLHIKVRVLTADRTGTVHLPCIGRNAQRTNWPHNTSRTRKHIHFLY